MLQCQNLTLSYAGKAVLQDFSLSLPLTGVTALRGRDREKSCKTALSA